MAETSLPAAAGADVNDSTKPASKGVIVIKIGTSSLMREGVPAGDDTVSSAAGAALGAAGGSELALSTLALLVDTVLTLRRDGWDVIIVSSGAVGVGCSRLGTAVRPIRGGATAAERAANLAAIQAYAAIGQSVLMRTYDDLFRMGGQPVAQVLLTSGDLSSQYQYGNAKATLRSLLAMGVVPIVNENDTVATEELRYGDNDWLSALVACVVDATWLFLLTDVERLYTADPRRDAAAEAIDLVSAPPPLQTSSSLSIAKRRASILTPLRAHPLGRPRLLNTLNAVLHLLVELAQPVEVLLRRLPIATTIRLKQRRHHRAERVGVELQ